MVYGSVVIVPLQNKDCSGLPGPLPPAAWGVGRAAGGAVSCQSVSARQGTDLCAVDLGLILETHTSV